MSEQKGLLTDKNLFIVLTILFVILGVGYFLSLGPLKQPEIDIDVSEVEKAYNAMDGEEAVGGEDGEEMASDVDEEAMGEDTATEETAASDVTLPFDMANAKKERILGDPSAPIKITEHSSFSCPHCAHFHRDTYPALKENLIDTGEAYLVFSDFPLNAPALHASLAARCVDEDRYFDFVDMLFSRQDDWATQPNYLSILEGYAADFGLDKATFAACVQNKELQETLLNKIRAVQQQYNINSTPSFVINNQEVIGGAFQFPQFEEALEAALKNIEEGSSVPDAGAAPAEDEGAQ
ncbi:MAG: DsbA family protein [Alphaproteobacteria bacterium]|nr:DsbA family protein [Alphaproteobacteria bacterium]